MKVWPVVVAVTCAGCGTHTTATERLTPAEAAKLPHAADAWDLCPPPDVRHGSSHRAALHARERVRTLLGEVRRRPDAEVTLEYEDAHSGEPFTERVTVRGLAREHLEDSGDAAESCGPRLMAELRAAVDGRPARNEAARSHAG